MSAETQSGYCLGHVSQIPFGEGRTFRVGEQKIAVFRSRGGGVYATQAVCPHRGGPLADGLVGGTTLVCPLHAWKFELSSGEVLLGSQGIATYPIALNEQGDIVLELGELPSKSGKKIR